MPTQIEKYRMRDGVTRLEQAYFNPIWQDLDVRLAAIEEKRISYDAAVDELTGYGLLRINELIIPTLTGLNESVDQAHDGIAAVEKARLELLTAIAEAAEVMDEIVSQAYLDNAITTLQTTVNGQLSTLQTTVNGQLSALQTTVNGQLSALEGLIFAGL